ncbi:MAG: hypothetical protein ACI8PZ_005230 [Myxococcota bacterium]|jgi:hypothetical protein
MSDRILLHLLKGDKPVSSVTLGAKPLQMGRSPSNDVVLADSTVSWHHAVAWLEGGAVWLRDLGSRNGTFVNDTQVKQPVRLGAGDVVRVGQVPTFQLPKSAPLIDMRSFIVEDVESGAAFPVRADRFNIGSSADADLYVDSGEPREATLMVHTNGELWVGTDSGEFALELGVPFEVAGRRLLVREVDPTQVPTIEVDSDRYPYRVETTLNGASGPEAVLIDLVTSNRYLVSADNRAILLHILVQKILTDREENVQQEEQGWCSDDGVRVGIWGRRSDQDANSLHVLVYRLRSELKKAGFDPWFIEKRRKAIRARVREVVQS